MKIKRIFLIAAMLLAGTASQCFAWRAAVVVPIPVPVVRVPAPAPAVVVAAPVFYGGWWWWNSGGYWHRSYHRGGALGTSLLW